MDASSFATRRMVSVGRCILPKIVGQIHPTPSRTAIYNRYSFVATQTYND